MFTYTAYMATLPILLLSFLRQAGQWVKILTKQKSQVIKCIRQKCVTKFHQSQTLCGWNVGDILNFNKVQEKSTLIYRFIAFLLKMRLRWVKIASVYGTTPFFIQHKTDDNIVVVILSKNRGLVAQLDKRRVCSYRFMERSMDRRFEPRGSRREFFSVKISRPSPLQSWGKKSGAVDGAL